MRFFLAVLALLALCLPRPCSGGEEAAREWTAFAGFQEEGESAKLELRDELIAANLASLAALEKAIAEAVKAETDELAWARVEYLLETAYLLLDDTGEFEGFLKATAGLAETPPAAPIPPIAPLDSENRETAPAPAVYDGGLLFEDADGAKLEPVHGDDGWGLRYSATGGKIGPDVKVYARPIDEDAGAHPAATAMLVKARAAWLRTGVCERLGRIEDASKEARGLGLVRDWLVLGPFENDVDGYSDVPLGPELALESLEKAPEYQGKDGAVRWRAVRSLDRAGRLYPEALFRSGPDSLAFALALVWVDKSGPAVVRVGADGPCAVWINQAKYAKTGASGTPSPDQDAFGVWLDKGWNLALVKTFSGPERWRLSLRFTGLDGRPLDCRVAGASDDGVRTILGEASRAARQNALDRHYLPARVPDMGGMTALSRHLRDHPDDGRACFYLGTLLYARRLMEGRERFDRELLFRRAVELSDFDPYMLLIASRSAEAGATLEREDSLRLAMLEKVAAGGSAAALVDMGRLYLDVMRQPRRAYDFAARALEANPMSSRAGVLEYDAAVARGWEPLANAILERLEKRHPSSPAVRMRSGRNNLERGRYRKALEDFHLLMNVNAENVEALSGAVGALARLGQTSASVSLLTEHLERFPYDFRVRLNLAGLYRFLGRTEDCLAVLEAALALSPYDSEAREMREGVLRETASVDGGGSPALPVAQAAVAQETYASPSGSAPSEGWEYLNFQIEDRLARDGSLSRAVSFVLKIYTSQAARTLRQFDMWLNRDFESGGIERLTVVHPDGKREDCTPSVSDAKGSLRFYPPPLRSGMLVEAKVEIKRDRVRFLGDYFGQIAPLAQRVPVRQSRYVFVAPRERRLYFHSLNGAPNPMVIDLPDRPDVTRVWEMRDLAGYVQEPHSPSQYDAIPCVQISSLGDWNDFARWYWRLVASQYQSPPELRVLARRLEGDDPAESLRRAADWVSLNLGQRDWEGGTYAFRPVGVRSILAHLSADRKDRTLLMCLFAREYGLDAWPVLARARETGPWTRGVSDMSLPLLDVFNHSLAMVALPDGGQLLVDAANPYRSPLVMPQSLSGAEAVAVKPDQGERMTIPDAGVDSCSWSEEAELVVDADGALMWEEKVTATGAAASQVRLRFGDPETREAAWTSYLRGLGAEVSASALDYSPGEPGDDSAFFSARARLKGLSARGGNRILARVPPLPGGWNAASETAFFPLSLSPMAKQGVRRQDLVLPGGFRVERRLRISYPREWRLANIPSAFREKTPFGEISLEVEETPGSLFCDFSLVVPGHLVKAGDFALFRRIAALSDWWQRPLFVWEDGR